jgi:hypothetical protein
MRRSSRLVVILLVGLGVLMLLLISNRHVVSADPKPKPDLQSAVGRYQVFKSQNLEDDCLLDTATGKVWRLKAESKLRGEWVLAVESPK